MQAKEHTVTCRKFPALSQITVTYSEFLATWPTNKKNKSKAPLAIISLYLLTTTFHLLNIGLEYCFALLCSTLLCFCSALFCFTLLCFCFVLPRFCFALLCFALFFCSLCSCFCFCFCFVSSWAALVFFVFFPTVPFDPHMFHLTYMTHKPYPHFLASKQYLHMLAPSLKRMKQISKPLSISHKNKRNPKKSKGPPSFFFFVG